LSRYQKTKKNKKKRFFDVSGQFLSFNGQLDLFIYLRDHSAIFSSFGNGFDTLKISRELL